MDYYLWAREDGDGPTYELKWQSAKVDDWQNIIEKEAAGGLVIIGFNNAPTNGVWYLVAKH